MHPEVHVLCQGTGSPAPRDVAQHPHRHLSPSTVSPSSCPALGWGSQPGMVVGQVVLPFALRLADVQNMTELKFFDHQGFSSHPYPAALAVCGRAEVLLQL